MSRLSCGVLACLSILWMVGCAEPSASGAGEVVSDSAGVRIVEIPRSPTASVRSLHVDALWMQDMELEVGRLGDVEILPGGSAVILDEMSGTISVLSPVGEILVEFGRLGEGPGEFSPGGISRVIATDSSLLVPDIQLQRITDFSLDGDILAIRPMPQLEAAQGPVHGVDWRAHPDGGIVFRALTPGGDLLLRTDHQSIDTLHVFDMPAPVPNRLLPPTPVWDLDPEGRVVVGRSDRGRIEVRVPGEKPPLRVVRWERVAGLSIGWLARGDGHPTTRILSSPIRG